MRLIVARVGKPFGVKGEMKLRVITDIPEERLVVGGRLFDSEEDPEGWVITKVRGDGQGRVVGLAGVTNRDEAEALRNSTLWAHVDPSDEGWYAEELKGRRCRSTSGADLGEVVGVEHHPAHDTLVVQAAHGQVLVPFVSQIVTEVGEELILDPPGGLFDDADE